MCVLASDLVDLGLVLDVFGTVGVSEGGEGLVVVVVRGAEAGHHQGLGVPAQRVLKLAKCDHRVSPSRMHSTDVLIVQRSLYVREY